MPFSVAPRPPRNTRSLTAAVSQAEKKLQRKSAGGWLWALLEFYPANDGRETSYVVSDDGAPAPVSHSHLCSCNSRACDGSARAIRERERKRHWRRGDKLERAGSGRLGHRRDGGS